MILDFKNWLVKEDGTSTACVATFAQPVIGMVRRQPKANDDKKKKKSH